VIRRWLSVGALAGVVGSFALGVWLWLRMIRADCSGLDDMSRGNCLWLRLPHVIAPSLLFGVFALILAALILLPKFKSTGE
jgi:hypothetical protein